MDAFSRLIVGWSMAGHLRKELVMAALDMAVAKRKPDSVIHHLTPSRWGGIREANIPRLPLGKDARRLACVHQRNLSVTAMTTPCVRVSLQRWNAN